MLIYGYKLSKNSRIWLGSVLISNNYSVPITSVKVFKYFTIDYAKLYYSFLSKSFHT